MRSGRCSLPSSMKTWRLVARKRCSSRAKKKPLALVSDCSPWKVPTFGVARNSGSTGGEAGAAGVLEGVFIATV